MTTTVQEHTNTSKHSKSRTYIQNGKTASKYYVANTVVLPQLHFPSINNHVAVRNTIGNKNDWTDAEKRHSST